MLMLPACQSRLVAEAEEHEQE